MLAGVPVRDAEGLYEEMLDDAIHYYFYADKFHWSSTEVDSERAWLIDAYEIISAAKTEAQERAGRRANHVSGQRDRLGGHGRRR